MLAGAAEAKTSAGAPCWIWVARAPDDPKLKLMVVPGWADWNVVPSWPKAAVSDDAADTVIDPLSLGAVVVELAELGEFPQAAAAKATAASDPVAAHRQGWR
jgi:hypothetical protein